MTDIKWFATDIKGNQSAVQTQRVQIGEQGTVGGSVPATLALTLGAPAAFGAFTPGVAREYTASTTATVISHGGRRDAVGRGQRRQPGPPGQRRVRAAEPLQGLGVVKTWTAPTSNEAVPVTFKQAIGANDPLRTGTYSKTLTFTLSTTSRSRVPSCGVLYDPAGSQGAPGGRARRRTVPGLPGRRRRAADLTLERHDHDRAASRARRRPHLGQRGQPPARAARARRPGLDRRR